MNNQNFPSTASDAGLQVDLFDRWGYRPPVALEKLLKAGDDL